jgi:hypothetical protein
MPFWSRRHCGAHAPLEPSVRSVVLLKPAAPIPNMQATARIPPWHRAAARAPCSPG